jgi:methionine-rich copper-binding protein CopC
MNALRRAAIVVAAVVAVLAAGEPAWAHNELREVVPAKDATVAAAPAEVVLEFAERLNPRYTTVAVTGPDGGSVADGKPRVDGMRAVQPLRAGADGTYTVVFRVVSLDGHPVQGRTRFTVRVPASAAPSASVEPSPTYASTPPSPAAAPPPAQTPVSAERRWPAGGWLVTIVLLLAAAGGGLIFLRRRRGSAP